MPKTDSVKTEIVWSHSRLSTYKQCPLKFKFSYLDRIAREDETAESFMGSLVHETLEKLYAELKVEKENSLEELLAHYRGLWGERWNGQVRIINRAFSAEHYRLLGERCLTDYYHHYHPFRESYTVGVEYRIAFPLDPEGRYVVQGIIDRLARSRDGAFEIHDYKTGGHLPTQAEVDADRQLALYQLGVTRLWPEAKEVRLIWHYLAFDAQMRSTRTADDLKTLARETIARIEEVESAREFPPRESPLCDWCAYQDLCPVRKHLFHVDSLPASERALEPGAVLVERFAALSAEKSQIEAKIERAKEDLVAFAEREGISVVAGSASRARIWSKEVWRFPKREEPGRADLERVLREGGLWDAVSSLDTIQLDRVLESGDLKPDLVAEITRLARRERMTRVYLGDRKR